MFEPVSSITYYVLDLDKQVLVCTLSTPWKFETMHRKWAHRAAALFEFGDNGDIVDVIRDLLANPQIRAIVFDGEGPMRVAFTAFWETGRCSYSNITEQHRTVVRQFVDLYDDDCNICGPLPPFWPQRLRYETATAPARTAPLK